MLVLTRDEVEELLDLDALPDALARAHAELSAGAVSMPARIARSQISDPQAAMMALFAVTTDFRWSMARLIISCATSVPPTSSATI